jgi:paraquat-inducible protein B
VIGAFVLGAVALAAAAVVVWGSGRLFRPTVTFVSYFSGSVNGLNLGAPVKFRGVQIGSVTQMRSRLAQAGTVRPEQLRIPVWFDVDLKQISDLQGTPIALDRAHVTELIAQGLRAQLQLESFVTGVLYVGLDFFPESPSVLVQADRPDVLEIPTVPTALERASQVMTSVLSQLEHADIDVAVHSVTAAVDGVNELVRSPDVARAVTAVREALESIRRLTDAGRPMVTSVQSTSAGARESLQHLDAALGDVRTLIDTDGPLTVELARTLGDLGEAARAVRDLAGYLERNPNALLVGRPGS